MSADSLKYWIDQIREFEWGAFEIGSPVASSDITVLENHLGFSLPNDLRDFYLIANGIFGDNNGWEYQIIGSVTQVIQNLEGIKKGRKRLDLGFEEIEIFYPETLRSIRAIPLDDANNAVGAGAFYLTEIPSEPNSMWNGTGIYRYLASQTIQIRDAEITFIAPDLGKYLVDFFGFDNAPEGAFQ
jgi:hypothetical protein